MVGVNRIQTFLDFYIFFIFTSIIEEHFLYTPG